MFVSLHVKWVLRHPSNNRNNISIINSFLSLLSFVVVPLSLCWYFTFVVIRLNHFSFTYIFNSFLFSFWIVHFVSFLFFFFVLIKFISLFIYCHNFRSLFENNIQWFLGQRIIAYIRRKKNEINWMEIEYSYHTYSLRINLIELQNNNINQTNERK